MLAKPLEQKLQKKLVLLTLDINKAKIINTAINQNTISKRKTGSKIQKMKEWTISIKPLISELTEAITS